MKRVSERSIENYLVKKVKELGGRAYKFNSNGNAGVPDRLVVLTNRIFFVELKTAIGVLSPLQKGQMMFLVNAGASVYLARSKDDVDKILGGEKETWYLS